LLCPVPEILREAAEYSKVSLQFSSTAQTSKIRIRNPNTCDANWIGKTKTFIPAGVHLPSCNDEDEAIGIKTKIPIGFGRN
jgi:hypothetical protein